MIFEIRTPLQTKIPSPYHTDEQEGPPPLEVRYDDINLEHLPFDPQFLEEIEYNQSLNKNSD